MKDMYSPTGWENAVDCGNALDNEYPFTLKKTAPATQQARNSRMTDKPTPSDAEIWELIPDEWTMTVQHAPGAKALVLCNVEDFARAVLVKWGQPDQARAESVNQNNLENLLELIDNFAETRHTCGHWTYNLKSNEARQKVIAALKGNDLS